MSNEETKDCTRLPVVAWQVEFPLGNGAKVYEQRPSWAYESYGDLAYVTHELCRLTDAQSLATDLRLELNAKRLKLCAALKERNDAQAMLAQKDARIAEQQGAAIELARLLNEACEEIRNLKANIRTDNTETLANALKEIERLRLNIAEYNEHESCWRAEIANLRAQLEKLQAAPAERGAPDETAMARALCNYHADLCGVNRDDQWNLYSEDFLNDVAVMLAAAQPIPAAPATADSDVREVK